MTDVNFTISLVLKIFAGSKFSSHSGKCLYRIPVSRRCGNSLFSLKKGCGEFRSAVTSRTEQENLSSFNNVLILGILSAYFVLRNNFLSVGKERYVKSIGIITLLYKRVF